MTKDRCAEAVKGFLLFCVFPVLLYGSNALADELGKNMAEIIDKAPNCIVIANYRFNVSSNHVIVTSSSSIIDIDGKRISLKLLKVPCVAKISLYQSKKKLDPELIRLEVKEYAQNASSGFTIKEPFAREPE
jgi:hypothetical protein